MNRFDPGPGLPLRRRPRGERSEGMAMSDGFEDFNMTMRKFLKQVGVTSQQAIEDAMRKAGPETTAGKIFTAKMVLTVDELDLAHSVEGRISGRGE